MITEYAIEKQDHGWMTEYRIMQENKEQALLQVIDNMVEYIQVRPSARGRGLATALYEYVTVDIGFRPAPHWVLDTTEAIGFWAKLGFTG